MCFADLDAHQPEFEQFRYHLSVELPLPIHSRYEWADAILGKGSARIAEQGLIFRQDCQRKSERTLGSLIFLHKFPLMSRL